MNNNNYYYYFKTLNFLTERGGDSVLYFLYDLHETSETIHNNYLLSPKYTRTLREEGVDGFLAVGT